MEEKHLDCATEIQHDWNTFANQGQTFWARCTLRLPHITDDEQARRQSQLEEEEVTHEDLTIGFEDSSSFIITQGKTPTSIIVDCPRLAALVEVYSPSIELDPFSKSMCFSVDISPDEAFVLAAGDSGNLKVFDRANMEHVSDLVGHIGDVTVAKFFPSSKVILSGGMDYKLRIWGVTGGAAVREMIGHQASVTDVAMVDRGREVLSCGRDGTVRLWNCASGANTYTWDISETSVNALALASVSRVEGDTDPWNWICGACGDGSIAGCDVRVKDEIFRVKLDTEASFDCLKVVSQDTTAVIAGGTSDGSIYCWDVRNTGLPLARVRVYDHQGIGITSIQELPTFPNAMWITTTDGRAWEIDDLNLYTPKLKSILTGPFYKPIFGSSLRRNEVSGQVTMATAARDGLVRIYELPI